MGAVSRPDDPAERSRRRSACRCGGWASSGSTSCSSTGGTIATAAISTRSGISPICGRKAKSVTSALTNFDTERLAIIAEHGIPIVSNQVQYSLVDRRPEAQMAAFCREHGITLLAYGTLLGGLLSEKYLGRPEPGRGELDTASLQKYKQHDRRLGRLGLFQELLAAVKQVADKHGSASPMSAPAICSTGRRWPASIIGARLGIAEHIADNARTFDSRSTPTISPRSSRCWPNRAT